MTQIIAEHFKTPSQTLRHYYLSQNMSSHIWLKGEFHLRAGTLVEGFTFLLVKEWTHY